MISTAPARVPVSTEEFPVSPAFVPREAAHGDSPVASDSLPGIRIDDHLDWMRIIVPVGDVDLRKVWIFATPRSVSIEIRTRDTVAHHAGCCQEVDERRIIRELTLPHYIKEGCTTVMPLGSNLEITCVKDSSQDDKSWAEMLHFDTRASFGSI